MSQNRTDEIAAAVSAAIGNEANLPPTGAPNAAALANQGAAMTAEEEAAADDVLRKAEITLSTIDPSLVDIDKLNEAFQNVLLYGGSPVYGVDLGDGEADDALFGSDDEAFDDGVASSRGSDSGEGEPEPDDDDIIDWDKISEGDEGGSEDDDDDDEDGAGGRGAVEPIDQELLNWLDMEGEGDASAFASNLYADEDDTARDGTNAATALEADLERLQLTELDDYIANGSMPERFMAEAVANNRPNLKNIPLPQEGSYYKLNDEPSWILWQLRKPGYMLSRSSTAAEECRSPLEVLRESPLVKSIALALHLMTEKHLEPAHIAIYYQNGLQPLLDAFYDGRQHTMEDGTARLEAAFSATTGQRQLPFKEGDYSIYAIRPAVADDVDPLWRNERRQETRQRAIRRPTSITLGRILWQIFDLDMLCHKLERGRLALILDMKYNHYFLGSCMNILEAATFQDPAEMLFWAQYTKYCARRLCEVPINRGTLEERKIRAHRNWNIRPTAAIEDLDLGTYYNDLFLPATTFQENLANPTRVPAAFPVAASREGNEDLFVWLTRIGAPFGKDAVRVLKLFVGAFVEQYSKLPLLRKIIYDTFLELGEITVCPIGPVLIDGFSTPQVFRITQLLGQNPLLFLRLHQYTIVPAGQTAPISITFSVNNEFLVDALRMKGLFMEEDPATSSGKMADSFAVQRSESFREMVQYVADQTVTHVRAALLRASNLMAATLSSTELGKLCAEGPYQPTKLVITPYGPNMSSWDSSFNVAESLPDQGKCIAPGYARVCGVYLADRTSTASFIFCDEFGGIVNTVRWISCNPSTPDGLQTHRRQCVALLSAIRKHSTNVIAVAMCGERATALFRTLEDFVRDYVWADIGVPLPVVWASGAAGTVFRFSDLADREMTTTDHAYRYAAATARYVRDPLMELCRFFEPSTKDILKFPLYVPQGADEDLVYAHLEREMSLWVTAVAPDLNAVLAQPRPDLILQFCAGLGLRKAAKILTFVTLCGGIASRQPLLALMEDLQTKAVGDNFIGSIRVEDNGQKAGEASVHPCDVTLIPPKWYSVADLFVQFAVAHANRVPLNDPITLNDKCPIHTSWARLLELSENQRWKLLADFRTQAPLLNFFFQTINSNAASLATKSPEAAEALREINERLIDLLFDELTAMGRSYQRRNYRRVTSRVLMKQLTNVSFFTRADVLCGASKSSELDLDPRELIVKEGDLLECSIVGVQGGNNPHIKVNTSRGLPAIIPVAEADMESDYMRREFFAYVNAREEARKNKLPFDSITVPSWLKRDEVIYGNVTSCIFQRCELRLRWAPAPIVSEDEERRIRQEEEEERLLMEEGEDELNMLSAYQLAGADGTSSSAVSSVKAVALNQHALVYRTKASRHALFRNVVSNGTIERLLLSPDVDIGEVLLRPVVNQPSWVTLCIKAGTDRVINWPIRECRGRSGNLYYEVPDRRLDKKQTFDSIDHCIFAFVEKMAVKIGQLRQHRRFYSSVEAAVVGIGQTIQERRDGFVDESRLFAYAFAETASPNGLSRLGLALGNDAAGRGDGASGNAIVGGVTASGTSPTSNIPYCVIYWINGRCRQSPVHVDNEGYYVKLKTVRSATAMNGIEWFRAPEPETLSFVIKNYASELQKLNARAKKMANPNTSISGRGGSSINGAYLQQQHQQMQGITVPMGLGLQMQ